jgi:lipoate synthase
MLKNIIWNIANIMAFESYPFSKNIESIKSLISKIRPTILFNHLIKYLTLNNRKEISPQAKNSSKRSLLTNNQ